MKNNNKIKDSIITPQEVKEQFFNYLTKTFGKKFLFLITPPDGVEIGERVLFKLQDGKKAERCEETKQETEEFHQSLVEAVGGIEGIQILPTEPPVSSGLPYPRIVDIRDWDIAYDNPAKEYLTSDALLPKENFSIDWLFGLVFGFEKQLIYIDFTHPKVKVIFSFVYDFEDVFIKTHLVYKRLEQFNKMRDALIEEAEGNPDLLWIKLVQIDETVSTQKRMGNSD